MRGRDCRLRRLTSDGQSSLDVSARRNTVTLTSAADVAVMGLRGDIDGGPFSDEMAPMILSDLR